jgi:hypothetical protein
LVVDQRRRAIVGLPLQASCGADFGGNIDGDGQSQPAGVPLNESGHQFHIKQCSIVSPMRAGEPSPADTLRSLRACQLYLPFRRGHCKLRQGEGQQFSLGIAVLKERRLIHGHKRERRQIIEERRKRIVLEKHVHGTSIRQRRPYLSTRKRTDKRKAADRRKHNRCLGEIK